MRPSRLAAWMIFLALVSWTLWLRWPGLAHRVWNVDEAIHSAIADRLLAGGVLYRDAIDQRTPLSYYAVAGLYAVAGRGNILALHVFTALLVAGTAFLLWRLGRAWRHSATGAWAAGLYATLASSLLYRGDANAFNTEWLVTLFTTGAALAFARARATSGNRGLVVCGALLGLAFLSKQPALLDAAAPVLALAYLAWHRRDERPSLPVRFAALTAGWATPVGLTAVYFAAHGALRDAVYYAWSYNVSIYGPEISTRARLASAWQLWHMLQDGAPALLGALLVAAALIAFRLLQRTPRADEERDHAFHAYVGAWAVTSLAGAISGGRGFDHYFVQTLPALCLLAGWMLDWVARVALAPHGRPALRLVAALVLATTLLTLGTGALQQRGQTLPPDTSVRPAAFIARATPPAETIFVWGYQPEFYLFAGRAPASRFVYASFLTGMVPWTNVALERDTSYAIVPGAMDTLLAELDARPPTFFVDCSAGPNRFWQKYPLAKFPALKTFVDAHYLLVDPDLYRGLGYDLYLLRDDARRFAGARPRRGPRAQLEAPTWFGPSTFTSQASTVTLVGASSNAQLAGLQLLVDGQVFAGVSFAPLDALKVTVPVRFDPHAGTRHTFQVRAIGADGTTVESPQATIAVNEGRLPDASAAPFVLPRLTTPVPPLFVQTPYGANVDESDGRAIYFAHAPSTLAYALPEGARAVRGGFGFRDAAFAPDNRTPTDGAEFRVDLVAPSGARHALFSCLLRPTTIAADRGVHPLFVSLPAAAAGSRLEFVITAGPNDNAATDWTFWTDLRIETSR
ncbi:ArnT family glycosyltransferase [Oleiharenicola sp. Vm1]|uniref:ArnT family glycosyltransferase n=1 Tax=Oleiharenicola sp. Vm1 TaxID=3398393 RepID=UPI0039F4BC8F